MAEAEKKPSGRGLVWVGLAMVILGPVGGFAATVLGVHGAFGGADQVDPAHKAKVVADGISGAMNWALFGTGVGVVGAAVLAVGIYHVLRSRPGAPKSPE
ncbi:MAG: MotA/TolQ/ExbB proton channel family protein [Myxococcales bacterium]|nr:hypothetical protein [Sorangiineae bacterium PRO1]MCL4753921.1 MotA/TolQ/ExbB proton channel family protein [Myxococcales bacterium]